MLNQQNDKISFMGAFLEITIFENENAPKCLRKIIHGSNMPWIWVVAWS